MNSSYNEPSPTASIGWGGFISPSWGALDLGLKLGLLLCHCHSHIQEAKGSVAGDNCPGGAIETRITWGNHIDSDLSALSVFDGLSEVIANLLVHFCAADKLVVD